MVLIRNAEEFFWFGHPEGTNVARFVHAVDTKFIHMAFV
jgi:hypothetical protein